MKPDAKIITYEDTSQHYVWYRYYTQQPVRFICSVTHWPQAHPWSPSPGAPATCYCPAGTQPVKHASIAVTSGHITSSPRPGAWKNVKHKNTGKKTTPAQETPQNNEIQGCGQQRRPGRLLTIENGGTHEREMRLIIDIHNKYRSGRPWTDGGKVG